MTTMRQLAYPSNVNPPSRGKRARSRRGRGLPDVGTPVLRFFIAAALIFLYAFKLGGADYYTYEAAYNEDTSAFEPAYSLLVDAFKLFDFGFQTFYAVYSIFNVLLLLFLFDRRISGLILIIGLLMIFPGLPLNTVRQLTAAVICAMALKHFPVPSTKYVLVVALGAAFHVSAALFLVPLLRHLRVRFLLVGAAVAWLAWVTYGETLIEKILFYVYDVDPSFLTQGPLTSFLYLIGSVLLFATSILQRRTDGRFQFVLMLASAALLAASMMSLATRFFYIFIPAVAVYLDNQRWGRRVLLATLAFVLGILNLTIIKPEVLETYENLLFTVI